MEKEIVLGRIVGPEVLDSFINLTLVFNLLKVLNDFFLRARTQGPIQQLVAGAILRETIPAGTHVYPGHDEDFIMD